MENKKMKLWKKILLLLLVIVIVFFIYVIRNFIIISNLEEVSKEYANKTNYIADIYSIQSNSVNILRAYSKDGVYLSIMETKSNDIKDTRKLTVYKSDNETLGVIQSGDKKIAILNNTMAAEIQVVTFESISDMNLLQKLLFSTLARISTEECNNKETFLVEMPHDWKMWVNKENGTIVREINSGFVTKRNYEFDIVKDEDIVKPDISDCEIQK